MATPTTNYTSGYPADKYSGNVQQERTESGRLVANARDYNVHDVEIRQLQCFLGISSTPFSPSGPVPGSGETIINTIYRIAGTASCLEQGVICNFGGAGGIDPGGLTISKTGESGITEMVNPPTGWVQLSPPDPSGVHCPPYPDQPPWAPTPNPGFPPYPVPDGYPWPQGFDPDVDDGFPMGTWMQWIHWAVGATMANWQTQNAQNIKLMPGGMNLNGLPAGWNNFLSQPRLWPNSTDNMLAGNGAPIRDFNASGHPSIFEAAEPLLHHSNAMSQMLGGQFQVFETDGSPGSFLNVDGAPGINTGSIQTSENANAGSYLVIVTADDSTAVPGVTDLQVDGGGASIVGLGDQSGPFRIMFSSALTAFTRYGVYYFYRLDTSVGKMGITMPGNTDKFAWNDLAVLTAGNTIATFTDSAKEDTRIMLFDNGVLLEPGVGYTYVSGVATGVFTGPVIATYEIADL